MHHITAQTEDPVIKGTIQTQYLIMDPEEMLIPVSVNAFGYRQTIKHVDNGYIFTVFTDIRPVNITHPFNFDETNLPKYFQCSDLKTNLTTSNNLSDALRACLGWLDNSIEYLDKPFHSQDFGAVMERKSGNCVGRANVLLKLLHHLDIKSNAVRGALYKNGSLLFHRWIEVAYNDSGFLPTSPGATQDFVFPDHIMLLPSDKISDNITDASLVNVSISVISKTEKYWMLDYWPSPKGSKHPITRRQTQSVRYQTALTGEVHPAGLPATVELQTSDQTRTVFTGEQGTFSFVPVKPGPYRLTVKVYDQEGFRRTGRLNAGERLHVNCNLIIKESEEE